LDIGNEKMAIDESTQFITLPKDFSKITATTDELIHKVFPNITQNFKNHQWLSARAILAVQNNDVNAINFSIQNEILCEATTYKSIDTVINQDEVVNYPTEFLNSLDLPGMSLYVLTLKIGVPKILLRNINPSRPCNGTRLSMKKMMNNITIQIYNFKWKILRKKCTVATYLNDSDRYAIRIQTFAVSGATCICNNHQQSTGTIATSVRIKLGKSMLFFNG